MTNSSSFSIRPATLSDIRPIARVQVDSWRSTYADIFPADFLASLSYEQRTRQWTRALQQPERNFLFVAEVGSEVIGFVDAGPQSDGRSDYPGEIYAIYLLKQYQGKGIGRALFERAMLALKEHQVTEFMLWVLAANPARGFYERMGGQPIDERSVTIGGISVDEVAYGWDKIS